MRNTLSRRGEIWRSVASLLLLLCSALVAPVVAYAASDTPGSRPGVFLQGATVPRAKALALDAALIKGWTLAQTAPDHVIFETFLEEPAGIGPPNALPPEHTLLRIRADFVQTPAGVNAYLYAEEVWYAGSSREWISDVTEPYRTNLSKALSSLQVQWTALAKTRPGGTNPSDLIGPQSNDDRVPEDDVTAPSAPPKVRVRSVPLGPAPPDQTTAPTPREPTPPQMIDHAVGIWAYHAEQYASGRGCVLGDLGAVLVSSDAASELHKVYCTGGTSLMVRCDRERCYGAR